MKHPKHIAIVGAGPCGLMAAEILAKAGMQVTVYDRMPTPARKLLIAGRGGLNLTHSEPLDIFLSRYGTAAEWLTPFIHAFPPDALREWCKGLGQETFVGSSGRVFPKDMKAVKLLRAWLARLGQLGVAYASRHRWNGWDGDQLQFTRDKKETVTVKADATLLALGGASWPRLGSDGSWTKFFPSDDIAPLRPSNCGFHAAWSPHFSERFAGQPLKPVTVTHSGQSQQGEALITTQGIEGGIIYALSARLRETIEAEGNARLTLDVRPTMTLEALTRKLQAPRSNKSLSNHLRGVGLSPLIIGLLRETLPADQLSKASPSDLAATLKALPITLTAPTDIASAISSAGGIKQNALTADFMLRNRPGVFAAGEMLDWEAPTGGYLLQACFSTGVAAANGILHYFEKQ